MSELQESIMKAVQDALPGKVCDEVRKALQQNETLKKDKERLIEERDEAQVDAKFAHEELKKHLSLNEREEDLKQRERNLIERSQSLELRLGEKDLQCAQKIADNTMELMKLLTRNTEYRKSVYGSMPVSDGNGYVGPHPHDHHETTTEE